MEKEISIAQGLALTPYSDTNPDGQLAVSHNVEVYNGALRPSVIQGTTFSLPGTLLYIHETQNYTHYLYYDDCHNVKYAVVKDGEITQKGSVVSHKYVNSISSISHIGNVLIFLQEGKEIYYVIWEETKYKNLGNIPDLDIKFSLTCDNIGEYGSKYSNLDDDHRSDDLIWPMSSTEPDAETLKSYNATKYNIFGSLLGSIEEKYCDCYDGGFMYPFFARAAFRLYDGTYIKLSPPVLLVPNDCPLGHLGDTAPGQSTNLCYLNVYAFICKLFYETNKIPEEWSSIILGIDIFVSLPTFSYSLNGEELVSSGITGGYKNYTYSNFDVDITAWQNSHPLDGALYNDTGYGNTQHYMTASVYKLNKKSDSDIEDLGETSSFFLLKQIDYKDITSERTQIVLKKGQYQGVKNQNALEDEFTSREMPSASLSYVYNGRLMIYNCRNTYSPGFGLSVFRDTSYYISDSNTTFKLYYKIVRNNVARYVYAGEAKRYCDISNIRYIFNPNTNAKSLVICTDFYYDEIILKEHPKLHGNYYFNNDGYTPTFTKKITFSISEQTYDTDLLENYVYVSELNNPFLFPLIGQNAIGNGQINAITSITRAISEGQYGSFPLMAFCTDGNYSLGIYTEGDYAGLISSVNAMQPDICVNKKSVTQIEEGIMYVSERGVMTALANNIECISISLDGSSNELSKYYFSTKRNSKSITKRNTRKAKHKINSSDTTYVNSKWTIKSTNFWGNTFTKEVELYKSRKYNLLIDMSDNGQYNMLSSTYSENPNGYDIIITIGGTTIYKALFRDILMYQYEKYGTLELNDYKIEIEFEVEEDGEKELKITTYGEALYSDGSGNVEISIDAYSISDSEYESESGEDVVSDDDDTEIWYDSEVIVYKNLLSDSSRDFFVKVEGIIWDYVNQRAIFVARGYDAAYVFSKQSGTWSTIELPDYVKKVVNVYPYSYVQWENNSVTILDDDYNFDSSSDSSKCLLLTRPMKFDTLQMKKLDSYLLQGIFSEDQTTTFYGSNDCKTWTKIGSTTRKEVPHIVGRYYKYWCIGVELSLNEAENISGMRLQFTPRPENRLR